MLKKLKKQEQETEKCKFNTSIYVDNFRKNHLIKIYLFYLKEIEIINFLWKQ